MFWCDKCDTVRKPRTSPTRAGIMLSYTVLPDGDAALELECGHTGVYTCEEIKAVHMLLSWQRDVLRATA